MSLRIICTVSNDLNTDQRMIRICQSLTKAGYQVTLVGREKLHSKPLLPQAFHQVRLPLKAQNGKVFYLELNYQLRSWLRTRTYDILWAVDLDTLPACQFAIKNKPAKLIYDAHEFFTEVPELLGRPHIKRFWEAIGKRFIPKADQCITVSNSLGQVLSKKYNRPFHIIRNVPSIKRIQPAKKENPKVILYQGVLNVGRGLRETILAMHLLQDVRLWLVGDGDIAEELKTLVRNENLSDKVIFKGKIPPASLSMLTQKAWLGLNLLENNSLNYYYSLANKFFDYMMAGIPSINMDFPEYQSILAAHPMGLTINKLSPEMVAKTVQHLLDHPDAYSQMVQAANQATGIFNWEKEEKKLLALIEEINNTSS